MPSICRPPPRLARGRDQNTRKPLALIRLIYVSTTNKKDVQLVKGESEEKVYVVLSHRWGSTTGLTKTITENVGMPKEKLALDSLP